jgi:hypothetical protein
LAKLRVQSILRDRVLKVQRKDIEVDKVRNKVKLGVETPFQILEDEMVVMGRQMYTFGDKTLKEEVLR